MKKTIIMIGLSLLAVVGLNSAFANGVYLGGMVGAQSEYFAKQGLLTLHNFNPKHNKRSVNGTNSAGGIAGDIDFGYEQTLTRYFQFSLESNFMLGAAQASAFYTDDMHQNKEDQAKEKLNFAVGVSILPALRLGPKASWYARVGIGMGQIVSNANGFMYTQAASREFMRQDLYYIFGTGLSAAFSPHWRFRIEADYMYFNPFTVEQDNIDNSTHQQPQIYDYKAKYSPKMIRGVAGLEYVF